MRNTCAPCYTLSRLFCILSSPLQSVTYVTATIRLPGWYRFVTSYGLTLSATSWTASAAQRLIVRLGFVFKLGLTLGAHTHNGRPPWSGFEPRFSRLKVQAPTPWAILFIVSHNELIVTVLEHRSKYVTFYAIPKWNNSQGCLHNNYRVRW